MLKGILTGLLSKESRDKGYELSRDEDFIYLHLDGKLIGTFVAKAGITIQDIERFIQEGL
jgi:DNA-binding transcriptional MerR regulator